MLVLIILASSHFDVLRLFCLSALPSRKKLQYKRYTPFQSGAFQGATASSPYSVVHFLLFILLFFFQPFLIFIIVLIPTLVLFF